MSFLIQSFPLHSSLVHLNIQRFVISATGKTATIFPWQIIMFGQQIVDLV